MSGDEGPGGPQLAHRTWGAWPSVVLATDAVSVEVVSELGARVVSVRDRQRGREWLLQGDPPSELEQMAWAEEVAPYDGPVAFGWDECLPTTSACPDPTATGRRLRDHGDQWGRGAYLSIDPEAGSLAHTWSAPAWPYRLTRRLSFEDRRTLRAEYVVVSHAPEPLPLSWAAHPLLALEPGSILDLPDIVSVRRSWQHGVELADEMAWPRARLPDGSERDLSEVRSAEGWAAVLYGRPSGRVGAVAPDGARLDLEWDRDFAPAVRIWQSAGGWPAAGAPRDQVALEPCTSAHDDLVDAIADGQAHTLEPGGELRWWLRMRAG